MQYLKDIAIRQWVLPVKWLVAATLTVIGLSASGVTITSRAQALRLLELETGATPDQIKAARNALLKIYHWDRSGQAGEERCKEINLAYQYLKNPTGSTRSMSAERPWYDPSPAPDRRESKFDLEMNPLEESFGFVTDWNLAEISLDEILNHSGVYETFRRELIVLLRDRLIPAYGDNLRVDRFDYVRWDKRPEQERGHSRYLESRLIGALESSIGSMRLGREVDTALYNYQSLKAGLIEYDVVVALVHLAAPQLGVGAKVRLALRLAKMFPYAEPGLLLRAHADFNETSDWQIHLRRQIAMQPRIWSDHAAMLAHLGDSYFDVEDLRQRLKIPEYSVTPAMHARAAVARVQDWADRACEMLLAPTRLSSR